MFTTQKISRLPLIFCLSLFIFGLGLGHQMKMTDDPPIRPLTLKKGFIYMAVSARFASKAPKGPFRLKNQQNKSMCLLPSEPILLVKRDKKPILMIPQSAHKDLKRLLFLLKGRNRAAFAAAPSLQAPICHGPSQVFYDDD